MEYTEKKATKLKQPLEVPPTCRLIRWEKSIDFDGRRDGGMLFGVHPRQFHEDPQEIHPGKPYDVIFLVSYDVICFFPHFYWSKILKIINPFCGVKNQETSSMACGFTMREN